MEQPLFSQITAPWQKEFFKNVEGFVKFGIRPEMARDLLVQFLKLSSTTPPPEVMKCFQIEEALDRVGVYTQKNPAIRDFMVEFLHPLMKNFRVEGLENLDQIIPLIGKYPMTLISNHISHLDAPAIYNLLYHQGGDAKKLAENLVFIAGRLAFEPDFTRLGLFMLDTLLVCSKRDMADNPGQADLMTRINMRAFRQSQHLQREGKVIAIFPEGTRSRTGKLMTFVDSVYHYISNKIVIPISISGTDDILPTSTFLFNAAGGRLTIGRPVLVGRLPEDRMLELPEALDRLEIPEGADKKRFAIDQLALLVGQNLDRNRHGQFRNLFISTRLGERVNPLIDIPAHPEQRVAVIGHSARGTAMAAVLANKSAMIHIYMPDPERVERFNRQSCDEDHFPLFLLPPNIRFTSDPSHVKDSTLILQAARPTRIREIYDPLGELLSGGTAPVVNIMKGFTGSPEGLILADLEKNYGVAPLRQAVLAGACSPEQIMERKISGFELSAANPDLLPPLLSLFQTPYTLVTIAGHREDVRGTQLGGALKNVYAIGIGLMDGHYEKSLGGDVDNILFHAAHHMFLEMKDLGVRCGARESTFGGISGITDFMRTGFGHDAAERQAARDFITGSRGQIDPEILSELGALRVYLSEKGIETERFPFLHAIYAITESKNRAQSLFDELFSRQHG
jgi:glycerol-3-phosphate dehydrogenase/1-acyl-sn-glycerol-3-phosphate acyltransferase